MKATVMLLVILIFSANTAFAQEASFSATYSAQMNPTGNDIGVSKITPASFFYFLKTVRESLEMHFAQTPNVKFIRQLEFSTRRLREVKSLILNNRQDLIEPNLLRYWVYISTLIDRNNTDKAAMAEITNNLVVHIQSLGKMYPNLTNLRAKIAVRSTLNKIIEKVSLPIPITMTVCNLFAKEATSSVLTESEQVILKIRAEKCLTYL